MCKDAASTDLQSFVSDVGEEKCSSFDLLPHLSSFGLVRWEAMNMDYIQETVKRRRGTLMK